MSNKGTYKVADAIYELINTDTLTSEITGSIYKESEWLNDSNENVIIMTNSYSGGCLQKGLANVNIEIPANSNGTPKNDRFATIADIIRPLLEDVSYQGIYIRIINEQLFKEQKQNTNYWYNFKLNIT